MSENISDEALIEKIKNGDENSENELVLRYKDLVVKISRSYFLVGGDLEDLVQEGMIGLFKAIKNFSTKKDATFKTFAVLCIKHQIQSAVRKANTIKNKPLSSAISLTSFSQNSEDFDYLPLELIFNSTPDENAIDNENYENLREKIKNTLSEKEFNILRLYLNGYSYKEISTALQSTPKSIDNHLVKIKNKLREKLAL